MYRSVLVTKAVKVNYPELWQELKYNPHYQALGGQCAQQTLKSVVESFKSYNALLKDFWRGKISHQPRMPNYRTKGGLAPLAFPAQPLKFDLETGKVRLTLSSQLKDDAKKHLGLTEIWINGCTGVSVQQIAEVRILPRNGELYGEYVYKKEPRAAQVDPTQALGIDPGLNNWLTCVSTVGTSFIIDGLKVKSLNQYYNKRVANLKKGKPQGFWNNELAAITERRNRQMRDAVNKGARWVINHCLLSGIGTIVFGWNKGTKNSLNLGSKTNQKFVQVPTARLKIRIEQLCQEYGIRFIETEESYTSKASFLDNDFLPTFGEKPVRVASALPKRWKPSGSRVRRGLYQTANQQTINADCNGAANILRKVATQSGINLVKVGRGVLTLPARIYIWSTKRIKRREAVLSPPAVTV